MNAEMQDIQGILGGGSGGPIFGDRRLRAAAHQQNLKCPRCDSSNTKFCYYNNYNLSQPRHFCKNCRRYWTNGGVLRNVPVGGGCRKAKRTTKRKASSPAPPSTAIEEGRNKSNSRSSSESNSANTGTKDQSAVATAKSPSEFSSPPLFKLAEQPTPNYAVQEPTKADCSVVNPSFSQLNDSGGGAVFTEIGGFASFMSGNQSQNLFEFDAAPAPFRSHHQNQVNHHHQENQQLMQNWGSDVDLLPNSSSTDWRGVSGGERAQFISNLFDLTPGNSAAHWSGQSTDQWHESDHDQHLYLPP